MIKNYSGKSVTYLKYILHPNFFITKQSFPIGE